MRWIDAEATSKHVAVSFQFYVVFRAAYRFSICSHAFGTLIGKLYNYSLLRVSIFQRTNPSFTSLSNRKFMNCLKTSLYIEK